MATLTLRWYDRRTQSDSTAGNGAGHDVFCTCSNEDLTHDYNPLLSAFLRHHRRGQGSPLHSRPWLSFDQLRTSLEAVSKFTPAHEAQAHRYLTATGLHLAILLNFGAPSLQQKRIVRGDEE